MIYADYTYYIGTYGGKMSEDDFDRLSRQASAHIDRITGGKSETVTDTTILNKLKDACCSVSDLLFEESKGGEIASESNDGLSVSYVSTGKSAEQKIYDAVKLYLGRTGLITRWC